MQPLLRGTSNTAALLRSLLRSAADLPDAVHNGESFTPLGVLDDDDHGYIIEILAQYNCAHPAHRKTAT